MTRFVRWCSSAVACKGTLGRDDVDATERGKRPDTFARQNDMGGNADGESQRYAMCGIMPSDHCAARTRLVGAEWGERERSRHGGVVTHDGTHRSSSSLRPWSVYAAAIATKSESSVAL